MSCSSRPWETLAGLAAFACASLYPSVAPAEVTREFPETVAFYSSLTIDGHPMSDARCTGTFIRPRLLLTAAHCVRKFNISELNGHRMRASDAHGNLAPDVTARPDEVYLLQKKWWGTKKIHPVRVHVSPAATPVDQFDLSLSWLDQDLAILEFAAGSAATRDFATQTPSEGEPVLMTGFGHHGPEVPGSGGGLGATLPLRHFGRNTLYQIDGDRLFVMGTALNCENPGPYTSDWSSCPGDSGGPLISERTGEIIGISSTSGVDHEGSEDAREWRKHSVFVNVTSPAAQEFIRGVVQGL